MPITLRVPDRCRGCETTERDTAACAAYVLQMIGTDQSSIERAVQLRQTEMDQLTGSCPGAILDDNRRELICRTGQGNER